MNGRTMSTHRFRAASLVFAVTAFSPAAFVFAPATDARANQERTAGERTNPVEAESRAAGGETSDAERQGSPGDAGAELPSELAEKIKDLSQEKQDFLKGDGIYGFAARPEILWKRLAPKSPSEIEAYIDGMISVV